jgi:hypothetical protein
LLKRKEGAVFLRKILSMKDMRMTFTIGNWHLGYYVHMRKHIQVVY